MKIIISCTSTKHRLKFLYYMLESLKRQTLQPDIIYINLSKEAYLFDEGISELPDWLNNNDKVVVNFVENIGSYRKLIPLFEQNLVSDNDLIITVDDDILYGENWLKSLVEESDKNPEVIVCSKARQMKKNIFNKWQAYSQWHLIDKRKKDISVLATGNGGILYKKHFLNLNFLLDKKYLDIAPTTDDLWFKMASMKNNVKVLVCPYIDKGNIELKHDLGLYEVNRNNTKYFIEKVYNITIGKLPDYFGIPRTKNDVAWKKISKYV